MEDHLRCVCDRERERDKEQSNEILGRKQKCSEILYHKTINESVFILTSLIYSWHILYLFPDFKHFQK